MLSLYLSYVVVLFLASIFRLGALVSMSKHCQLSCSLYQTQREWKMRVLTGQGQAPQARRGEC